MVLLGCGGTESVPVLCPHVNAFFTFPTGFFFFLTDDSNYMNGKTSGLGSKTDGG